MVIETQTNSSEEQHSSVFISYAREDIHFVRLLDAALRKRDRESWVDLEDIRPTEEWLAGVFSGIEGANAFVFVISPDSVESKSCLQELAHAVEHNKRLVPIVCREVDASTVPEPLRSHQWIFFRDGDDFEGSFQQLVDALDTDLDWVHAHTRLLTRAIEWDANGRNRSFVLRGSDLRTAEEWQVKAADKEPKLTPLQTEYILAGRKDATRRQRITLGAVTFGLVVAILLSVIALWQRNVAVDQRNEAERQADIALGRQLAADAQLKQDQGGEFLELAMLFAVEADKQSPLPSVQAEQVLRRGLTLLPRPVAGFTYKDKADLVELDPGGTSELGEAVFSRDGRYLAATNAGETARVWDLTNDREVTTVSHEGRITSIDFSPDAKYLATASENKTARVWDTSSGEEISRINHGDYVSEVVFSPEGKYLATASYDNTVRLWNPLNGGQVARMNLDSRPLAIAFSPNGQQLAVAGIHTIRLLDSASRSEVVRMVHKPGIPASIMFSPDGKYLASASGVHSGDDTSAHVWDVANGEEVATVNHQGHIYDVAFSPDSKYLATASEDKTAGVWEVSSGNQVLGVSHEDLVSRVAFSPDGRYLATASYDNTARVWDMANGEEVARMIHDDTVKEAAFSPNGRYLATTSDDDTTRVWDLNSTRDFLDITHPNWNPIDWSQGDDAFTFSPSGEYMAAAVSDGTARVWNVADRSEVAKVTPGSAVWLVALSSKGNYLATAGENTAQVWAILSGEKLVSVAHEGSNPLLNMITTLAFSPDGKYLATVAGDTTIRVWSLPRGERVMHLSDQGSAIAFSPDGKYLATADLEGTVRVWENITSGGKVLVRMTHGSAVRDLDFSPDGRYVATASDDKTARLWKLPSGEEVARISHESDVNDVDFSSDGKYLASAGGDTAQVWRVAHSGKRVARMTHEDYIRAVAFSPDGRYLATARDDGNASVWDIASSSEVARMPHWASVTSVAFSPDGEYLAATGINYQTTYVGTRVWHWSPHRDLAEVACKRLTRNLTETEWRQTMSGQHYHKTCPNIPELK